MSPKNQEEVCIFHVLPEVSAERKVSIEDLAYLNLDELCTVLFHWHVYGLLFASIISRDDNHQHRTWICTIFTNSDIMRNPDSLLVVNPSFTWHCWFTTKRGIWTCTLNAGTTLRYVVQSFADRTGNKLSQNANFLWPTWIRPYQVGLCGSMHRLPPLSFALWTWKILLESLPNLTTLCLTHG